MNLLGRIYKRRLLRRIIFFAPLCLLFSNLYSQQKLIQHESNTELKTNKDSIIRDSTKKFTFSEKEAQFPGGIDSLMLFLNHNLHYPKKARRKEKEGKVIVQFKVCTDGKLCDLKIVKSVHELLDQESLRVVRMMPDWKPATMKGKSVPSIYQLPVVFKLVD